MSFGRFYSWRCGALFDCLGTIYLIYRSEYLRRRDSRLFLAADSTDKFGMIVRHFEIIDSLPEEAAALDGAILRVWHCLVPAAASTDFWRRRLFLRCSLRRLLKLWSPSLQGAMRQLYVSQWAWQQYSTRQIICSDSRCQGCVLYILSPRSLAHVNNNGLTQTREGCFIEGLLPRHGQYPDPMPSPHSWSRISAPERLYAIDVCQFYLPRHTFAGGAATPFSP